ncbi:MAG: inositol monophosphatase family protein [Acidobacteriota bacterium]
MTSVREFLDFAAEAAWQAGQFTLSHFQSGLHVDWKADESPVTAADCGAEKLLRELIGRRFPDHAVVGEEMGEADKPDKDSSHRWILDPIDGTQSFIKGVPLYGVLVGLEISGEMVVGVAHFPALKEVVAAGRGEGCHWNGRPARVSKVSRLGEALVVFTEPTGPDVPGSVSGVVCRRRRGSNGAGAIATATAWWPRVERKSWWIRS